MKTIRSVRVARPDAGHVDHTFAGSLDRRHGLRMGKTSRDGDQHVAQPHSLSSSNKSRGDVDTGKCLKATVHFPDRDHGIENMNDSLGLSGMGQFSGPFDVSGKILDLLLNPRNADSKLSSHERGSISPLNIVDVKIGKL